MIEKDTVILDLDDYNDLRDVCKLLEKIYDDMEITDKNYYISDKLLRELFDIEEDLKIILRWLYYYLKQYQKFKKVLK